MRPRQIVLCPQGRQMVTAKSHTAGAPGRSQLQGVFRNHHYCAGWLQRVGGELGGRAAVE